MITSTVEWLRPAPVKPYPKLMVSAQGRIVLFSSHGRGTIIGFTEDALVSTDSPRESYHTCDWDMTSFVDFLGRVTLEN